MTVFSESSHIRLRVVNDKQRILTVWIEPWAEEQILSADDVIDIDFDGPSDGTVTITHLNDAIVLHGFSGSSATAKRNGKVAWIAHERLQ